MQCKCYYIWGNNETESWILKIKIRMFYLLNIPARPMLDRHTQAYLFNKQNSAIYSWKNFVYARGPLSRIWEDFVWSRMKEDEDEEKIG